MALTDLVYPKRPAADLSDIARCNDEMHRQIAYGKALCRERAAFQAVRFWREFRDRMAPWMDQMHPSSAAWFWDKLSVAMWEVEEEHAAAREAFLAIGSEEDLDIERELSNRRNCPHHFSCECPP